MIKTLNREVAEETGLEIEVGDPFMVWYYEFTNREHRNYGKRVYIVGFKCRYISGDIKLSDEHNTYRLVDKNDYKEVDDGSDYFSALKKYFSIT